MMRPGWLIAVLAPAAVVAAAAWPTPARPGVDGTPADSAGGTHVPPRVGLAVGQGGCSSTGCHGAPAGDALRNGTGPQSWGAAALLWSAADPHRKAYAVLDGELATRMMVLLTGEAAPGVPKVKATADARCLACHTNPTLTTATDPHSVQLRAEGVSCEACHGNASGWLQSHTSFTPGTRANGYAAGGMAKLYDLSERAVACAGCHVGAPAGNGLPVRDMNHDMIAAGHPRLNFDFVTYQFMLPKHWYERDRTKPDDQPDPNFEARAWLVGRVAHAEAACRLTADRAKRADPWPEFAESSCVACHHTVANKNGPYPAPTGRQLGSLPWQPIWPVTRPGDLAALTPFATPGPAAGAVTQLLVSAPRPRPAADTGAKAAAAADALAVLRGAVAAGDPAAARDATARLLATAEKIPPAVWDRDLTEQVFHARAALERANLARGAKGDPARFAAAAEKLTLPRGTVRFDLPAGAADAVRGLLK